MSVTGSFPLSNVNGVLKDLQMIGFFLTHDKGEGWPLMCSMFSTKLTLCRRFARFVLPIPVQTAHRKYTLIITPPEFCPGLRGQKYNIFERETDLDIAVNDGSLAFPYKYEAFTGLPRGFRRPPYVPGNEDTNRVIGDNDDFRFKIDTP